MTEFSGPLTVEDVVKIVAESFDLTPKNEKESKSIIDWNLQVGKTYKVEVMEKLVGIDVNIGFYTAIAKESQLCGHVLFEIPNEIGNFVNFNILKRNGLHRYNKVKVVEEILRAKMEGKSK